MAVIDEWARQASALRSADLVDETSSCTGFGTTKGDDP